MDAVMEHKVVVDKQILADMPKFCATANVPEKYIRQSMRYECDENQVAWVKNFIQTRYSQNRLGHGGLLLTGKDKKPEAKCMAITGTLVRNFIDARIMTLKSVIDAPLLAQAPTVLVIPNLFISMFGKQLTAWQIQTLYDVLINRLTSNKPCVLYVEDMDDLEAQYGPIFADHLREHFES